MAEEINIEENHKNQPQNITVQEKIQQRQHQAHVLDLQGYSNQEIAEKLDVSISTIEKDLKNIRAEYRERLYLLKDDGYQKCFLDVNEQLSMIQKECWKMFNCEENTQHKIHLLSVISKTALEQKELLRSIPTPQDENDIDTILRRRGF